MNSEDGSETKNILAIIQKRQIKFAIYCLIVSGLVGVFYREFGGALTEGLSYFNSLHATSQNFPDEVMEDEIAALGGKDPLEVASFNIILRLSFGQSFNAAKFPHKIMSLKINF